MSADKQEAKDLMIRPQILEMLLKDRTTSKNIIWGTNNYKNHGKGYQPKDHIEICMVSGKSRSFVKPRTSKSEAEQKKRSKDMAEVFTPSWIVNIQNNVIDAKWFGHDGAFNIEGENDWTPTDKVVFNESKDWKQYVEDTRLEITCGEAPYLTSRYDATSGETIKIKKRIGLLDRKLRVIGENALDEAEWKEWAIKALKSVYGFDFQGDNVLLARENLFLDVKEYYKNRFGKDIDEAFEEEAASVISWNVFQMDGMKYVVPYSCHIEHGGQLRFDFLTGETIEPEPEECPGCQTGDPTKHNGTKVKIMDWKKNKSVKFLDVLTGRK